MNIYKSQVCHIHVGLIKLYEDDIFFHVEIETRIFHQTEMREEEEKIFYIQLEE